MSQTRFYLLVEVGPAKGQRHFIPENGAKLGRSSQNDICIVDPQLSRQHCAFEFREGHLWIRDLESANFTLVNNVQITEQLLRPGDRVYVGETVLRVVTEDAPLTTASAIAGVTVVTPGSETPPAPLITIPAPAETPTPAPHPAAPVIDLGLTKQPDADAKKANPLRTILYLFGAVAILVLGVLLIFNFLEPSQTQNNSAPVKDDLTLQFVYDKVVYSPDNIHRFYLTFTPDATPDGRLDGMLSAQINDIKNNRAYITEKHLEHADVERLLQRLQQADGVNRFMKLNSEYDAQNPLGNKYMSEYKVVLVVGKQARKTVVRNRHENAVPDFNNIRETLETFGIIELKLTDIIYPTETLIQMASEALDEAQTLVREASLDLGNLWRAIKRFEAAEANLTPVNPKPDFYIDIISGMESAREALETEYGRLRYSADHAINTSNNRAAQINLQYIKRLIPDEEDERHKAANVKLINIEARLR